MLSTSKLQGFSLSQPKVNEKLYKKQKFTPHMISPYEVHKNQLNSNAYEIKKKYPTAEAQQIKALLQQLDNNVEMVCDIIQQKHKKNGKPSMDEEKHETQLIRYQEKQKQPEIVKIEDVKLLKKSLVKLFKKLEEQKRQKEQLAKKVAGLIRQNQNLKLRNQQLLGEQTREMDFLKNLDIC